MLVLRIFHYHRVYADADHFVSVLDQLVFSGHLDVVAVQEKCAFGSSARRIAVEFQRDRRQSFVPLPSCSSFWGPAAQAAAADQ